MARRADPTPGHQRLLGLAAVAGLSVATALAFGRVFEGRLPTLELVAVALASFGVAVAFERRGLLLATLASLLGLALAIAWVVLPQTTWYGIPSIRTLRALGRSLEFVGQQARERVAPTPPLPPLLLAAVTAVWTAAFSSHALAIRAGSPLLAVLPPIALVGFADTVLEDGARPIYAIVLLAAAIAVVFADGLRRVRQWGPVWSSRSGRLKSSVRGSRPVAVAVIAVAVLVPGLLPGFRSDPLVNLSSDSDNGSLDPFVSIHAQLAGDREVRELFEVRAEHGEYWRMYTLDRFDGEAWTSSNPDGTAGGLAISTPSTLLQDPTPPAETQSLTQTVRVIDDVPGMGALPMAQTPVEISDSSFGDMTWDPARGQGFVDGGLESEMEYTVRSQIVVPTAQEVAPLQLATANEELDPWTQLPDDLDPRITQIAEDWTAGATSDYGRILDIQHRLRGPETEFEYDDTVAPLEGEDALFQFLNETKIGFCQQFAVAEATLLRALGIPARIAVGYQDGELRDDGSFLVTTQDAHAWVEVLFPTYGWLPFDPTPGRGSIPNAAPGSYLNPGEGGGFGLSGGPGIEEQVNPDSPTGSADQRCENPADVPPQQRQLLCQTENRPEHAVSGGVPLPSIGTTDEPDRSGYSVPYRKIFLGLLVGFVLFLIVVPIVKAVMRRRLLRRSREPREHVLAAYRVFDGEAADIGLGRRDGETIEEHRARLAASVAFSDGHLVRLTSLAARAAYAPQAPSRSDADASTEDVRMAIRDLRKEAGLLRRITGTYRPGL
jgi:TgpA N-terminal domain/Transglutaminase-like superfamily